MKIRDVPRHTLPEAALLLGISYSHMQHIARETLGLTGRGQRVSDAQIEALRARKTAPGREAGKGRG